MPDLSLVRSLLKLTKALAVHLNDDETAEMFAILHKATDRLLEEASGGMNK